MAEVHVPTKVPKCWKHQSDHLHNFNIDYAQMDPILLWARKVSDQGLENMCQMSTVN